ncbi:enoyl-CoA hydratase/isomerase family protein [Conexibacter sp. CPCC 206217]|uniref:enoyl-CoA hydratase/isomerase family protein n=1 Tax=Conexibacter sp. CPCC 206217 TaxID=3064574 RepID=UPI002719B882|nr:enoyl-CoA hydratase-related protein [Conexibacter sp. CPCC 206217]MDO8210178.1 enoyl-CoA hydratase-related protein [Conexibacter sp. CPCC 206217]
MSYQHLLYETDDRTALITLNRPDKMNALSLELCDEIERAVAAADADEDVRVVVVTGAGGKAFSSGYDLVGDEEVPSIDFYADRLRGDLRFTYCAWNCSKPVIAMIDGYCLAGGLEFAQMCDIRYCSDDARFAVIETRFSAGVATLAMPWVIGPISRELIYSGDMIDATAALRVGLVNRVFPKDALHAEVMKTAKRIARVSLTTLQWNKRAINETYEAMGFGTAMRSAMQACVIADSTQTPEYADFHRMKSERGLAAALKWRREQFAAYE